MSLFIYVPDPVLREHYRQQVTRHRSTDSGFDLPSPETVFPVADGRAVEFNLGCICVALTDTGAPAPHIVIARSSTAETPLRMSNQISLSDAGYRGPEILRVDLVGSSDFRVEQGRRLFQVVQHTWMPWKTISIVEREEDLPPAPDSRGRGGYGSTGI
jgi:dUTPase